MPWEGSCATPCGSSWQARDGVSMVSGIEHVTRVAEAAGWNVAMYQYAQAQIGDGGVLEAHRLLGPGGVAYLSVGNWSSYRRLLHPWTVGTGIERSLRGYRIVLARTGFADIRFYAPLPNHEGIPLFYVPLDDAALFQ